MAEAHATDRPEMSPASWFSLLALVLLGTRFVQGFIFWGGASRRLIYDFKDVAGHDLAVKLDFESAHFVAAKLTHALPGAVWIQGPLEWTLQHPDLMLASVWVWTLAELAVGLGLIFGLATRLAASVSIGLNVALMLIFGWMGSTCLDEWTMAVSGLAMSSAIFLAGGGCWSLDCLIGRTGWAKRNGWTNWIFSGPLAASTVKTWGLALAVVAIVFTVGSYNILFGAVVSPLHSRVNFHHHNVALSNVVVAADTGVTFKAYVNAGPDTGAVYVIAARLVDKSGATISEWDGAKLAALPATAFDNLYPYAWASKFKTEKIGFSGQTGAHATITLPPPSSTNGSGGAPHALVLEAINGASWRASVK